MTQGLVKASDPITIGCRWTQTPSSASSRPDRIAVTNCW